MKETDTKTLKFPGACRAKQTLIAPNDVRKRRCQKTRNTNFMSDIFSRSLLWITRKSKKTEARCTFCTFPNLGTENSAWSWPSTFMFSLKKQTALREDWRFLTYVCFIVWRGDLVEYDFEFHLNKACVTFHFSYTCKFPCGWSRSNKSCRMAYVNNCSIVKTLCKQLIALLFNIVKTMVYLILFLVCIMSEQIS